MSTPEKPNVDADIAEIQRVHDEWWEANRDFDVARMRACFAGDRFLQYNLNGHTYRSLDELTQLWESLRGVYGIPEFEVIDLRIEVRGEMAWVAHEAVIGRRPVGDGQLPATLPDTRLRVRETEVLHKDDGAGNAVWKIWHHHCSIHAPDDEVRAGFDDCVRSRAAAAPPSSDPGRPR